MGYDTQIGELGSTIEVGEITPGTANQVMQTNAGATAVTWVDPSSISNLAHKGSATISGAAAQDLNVTGLDLDTDKMYMFRFVGKYESGTGGMDGGFILNADETSTNYRSAKFLQTSTTLAGEDENHFREVFNPTVGQFVDAWGIIYLGFDGLPRMTIFSNYDSGGGAQPVNRTTRMNYSDGTNVTQIGVSTDSAGDIFSIGSRLDVWKVTQA